MDSAHGKMSHTIRIRRTGDPRFSETRDELLRGESGPAFNHAETIITIENDDSHLCGVLAIGPVTTRLQKTAVEILVVRSFVSGFGSKLLSAFEHYISANVIVDINQSCFAKPPDCGHCHHNLRALKMYWKNGWMIGDGNGNLLDSERAGKLIRDKIIAGHSHMNMRVLGKEIKKLLPSPQDVMDAVALRRRFHSAAIW